MITGFAAKSAQKGKCWSIVHVFENGKALCRYKPASSMIIQFCAHDIKLEYLECTKCKEKAYKILEKNYK